MAEKEKRENLEDLFERLESVITDLEGENVTLEESFQLYDQGMKLLKKCSETIDEVEKKVMILDEDGEAHEF
ncbi:exodeoxyribonuclease VII small subunit [Mediterraneibacter sp. NSJ-55]|uniref:Exodeoxyribonuclease 7 small subunit n=1 Tax=Mediterraneibacter hominis TaxID=2763054 RepID=A0A923RP23_9FIRM|nr:exodeoxyribonuclease VII small subunit [Mediterraneibacter hominis]MBC5688005.1 exodeoxyribonuclease VII small subunit [Mediterraneibacter hominis]